jgi:hypothetical protein
MRNFNNCHQLIGSVFFRHLNGCRNPSGNTKMDLSSIVYSAILPHDALVDFLIRPITPT